VQPSEKDAGDYVCVIKNDAGEISKKISVAKSKWTFYYETVTFDIHGINGTFVVMKPFINISVNLGFRIWLKHGSFATMKT